MAWIRVDNDDLFFINSVQITSIHPDEEGQEVEVFMSDGRRFVLHMSHEDFMKSLVSQHAPQNP